MNEPTEQMKSEQMDRLKGKVAIVTGGSLGIGRAVCAQMAAEGAHVAVTDIQEDEGISLVSEIQEAGGTARFWRLDVSQEAEVRQVFAEVREAFGRIDVLVNNAGISGVDKPTASSDQGGELTFVDMHPFLATL